MPAPTRIEIRGDGWTAVTESRPAFGAAKAVAAKLRAKGATVEIVDGVVIVDATRGIGKRLGV